MESSRGVCGKLPAEIIERVLSFLPVPVLSRIWSACKSWNELIGRPSFHDLCDLNGKNDAYLFMWGKRICVPSQRVVIDPIFSATLSFLDLDARRWYSIQTAELPRVCGCGNEIEIRVMGKDDGLVCELTSSRDIDSNFASAISDPVGKTRSLPAPPEIFAIRDSLPQIVTVWMMSSAATRSFS